MGLDELVAEIAPELMEDRARRLTALEVRNAIGGRDDLGDLDDEQYERLVDAIVTAADTADITITIA